MWYCNHCRIHLSEGLSKCHACGKSRHNEKLGAFAAPLTNDERTQFEKDYPPELPVSRKCPKCHDKDYSVIRPRFYLSISMDQVCITCGTKYSPPPPFWLGVLFMVIGAPLFSVGVLPFIVRMAIAQQASTLEMTIEGIVTFIAGLFIYHSVRILFWRDRYNPD